MQWFKTHADFVDHPKTLQLNLILNDDKALYYVVRLWAWTCKFAESGDLSKFTSEQIEKACNWAGEKYVLMQGLIDAGFIDKSETKMRVHDWFKENTRHLKDIDRKRRARTGRARIADNPQSGDAKGALQDKTHIQDRTHKQESDERFKKFWMVCTNKAGKVPAKKAWDKLSEAEQLKAIEIWPLYAKDCEQKRISVKHPQGWLNDKRFDDQFSSDEMKAADEKAKKREACLRLGHTRQNYYCGICGA